MKDRELIFEAGVYKVYSTTYQSVPALTIVREETKLANGRTLKPRQETTHTLNNWLLATDVVDEARLLINTLESLGEKV